MESRATSVPAAETRDVRREPRDPRISGSIVAELRAQMLELGIWDRVRGQMAEHDPLGIRWVDDAATQSWVEIETYVSLIEAMGVVLGAQAMRELGRARVARSTRTGIFASIVRGWMRSFADRPFEVVRIVPHLWRAATRDAGQMTLVGSGEGFARFRLRNAPPALIRTSWHTLLEGMGLGLLDLAHATGEVQIGPALDEPGSADMLFFWKQRPA